jgi:hypothetical protein
VAEAVRRAAETRGIDITLVRNGSRGLFWLEPLLEVETQAGRIAFGPVTADDVELLFDAGFHPLTDHPLCLGLTDEIPYLKRQERLTFARAASLIRCRRRLSRLAAIAAAAPSPRPAIPSSTRSCNPACAAAERLPTGHQVADGARQRGSIHRL